MQVIYAIRGYDRLKRERGDILAGNRSADDGMPKSPTPGDPVAEKATKLAAISSKIDAIDRAIARVPQEYRQGVLDNVFIIFINRPHDVEFDQAGCLHPVVVDASL